MAETLNMQDQYSFFNFSVILLDALKIILNIIAVWSYIGKNFPRASNFFTLVKLLQTCWNSSVLVELFHARGAFHPCRTYLCFFVSEAFFSVVRIIVVD